jgi:hypothetical protein
VTHSISNNPERIDLHDSYAESITRRGSDIIIPLSHGWVDNYEELGINEGIVFGSAILTFLNVEDERFKSCREVMYVGVPIEKPSDFESEYSRILRSTFTKKTVGHSSYLMLDREETQVGGYNVVEWFIRHTHWTLEWDSYVLHSDWRKGAIPD